MSNTIPRGKGRGKPVIQEGNALNVGGPHSNGAPIGALAQQQPPYVTPSVPMHMPPPGPDYNSGPHYVIPNLPPNPTVIGPAGTQVTQNMSAGQTHPQYLLKIGAAPHQTQQPHTFRPPNNAYYTQQPYQYAQSPFPYQQQYQYGADSDPFMQHPQPMFQNQMMMAQSMSQMHQSSQPPPQPRKKNVLTIQDPNSGEVINKQEATSDPKNNDEKTVPIAEENVHTEEAAHATAVRKQFAQQIQEQMGGTHRKSVSESSTISNMDLAGSTEISETTMRSDTTVANKSTVEEVAVKEELKEKEHNIENETASSISVKETASFVTVKETPIVEITPVKQTLTDDTLVESDESPLHPVPASVQPEMSPSSASEPIEEESAADVDVVSAEPAESSAEKSDAEIEVVGEEFPVDADLPEASYPDAEEEERRKAEEEAERKRAREAELDALLESLLSKPEEVDSTSLSYGRSFLYCVRDIEKEFKRTSCPLTNDALVQLGIDLSSMPKSGDGKIRPHNFNPSWLNSTRPSGSRPTRPYGGRFSQHNEARGTGAGRGGGGHKKFPPSARPSIERNIERVVPLHKSENAWKAEKIRPEDMDKEDARVKQLLKNVRSLMNKITPTTKDDLIKEFLSFNVSSTPDQLASIIDIIFDKAVEEPKFCPLYSEVCKKQVENELKENQKLSRFRNALLNRAQQTFVSKTQEEEREKKVKTMEDEEDPKKKQQLKIDLQESDNRFRRRKFGNITFIGQLFRQSLLSTKIVQWCLYELMRHSHPAENGVIPEPPYDEESLQCAVQLIETLGKQLEQYARDGRQYLDQTMNHLQNIAPKCSNKIRFMILNVVELRKNNWVQRKTAEQGPKKIAEIHNEIKQEQLENQQQRESYERKHGLRTGSSSLRGRGPPVQRNSLDSRFGGGSQGKSERDRRAAAAASAKLATSTVQPKNVSLSKMDSNLGGKKSNWRQGSGGGGNTTPDAGPVKPNPWNKGTGSGRDNSDIRKSSMDEKQAALTAAKNIGSGQLSVQRSSSQTSIFSQESDTEDLREKCEANYSKIMNMVDSDLKEYEAGDLSIQDFAADLFDVPSKEKYGKPPVSEVFRRIMQASVEKVKKPLLSKLGHVLCFALQKEESKAEALQGIAKYCQFAVDTETWIDFPEAWNNLSEVLINAIQCDLKLFEGKRPSINDFSEAFVEASKDDRENKPYQLLVTVLRRMSEINVKLDPHDHATMSSMVFGELSFLDRLDRIKLDTALKACRPDVPDTESLYALLNH